MKIENQIFYQIATDRNYKVGDILEFGKTLNGQGQRILNSKFNDGEIAHHTIGFENLNSKSRKKRSDILEKICVSLAECDFVIRELAVERVRRENYPHLPSRLSCMFVLDDREKVIKGLKTFPQKGRGKHFQAIAIKLTGEIFYSKDVALPRTGYSYAQYQEIADKYWSQNQLSQEETKEILFEGKAEVVEIIDEYTLSN